MSIRRSGDDLVLIALSVVLGAITGSALTVEYLRPQRDKAVATVRAQARLLDTYRSAFDLCDKVNNGLRRRQ